MPAGHEKDTMQLFLRLTVMSRYDNKIIIILAFNGRIMADKETLADDQRKGQNK